jgi:sulfur carrier protein
MRILLNGQPHELDGPVSVSALLAHLDIDPRVVAVELNRVVVKRARYPEAVVTEGSEVEIVAFVGGGRPSRARPGADAPHRPALS